MRTRSFLALVLAVALVVPPDLCGQDALGEAETFLARGMVLLARERLEEWWENQRPQAGRTELQRGIWLRGKLTVDPSLAALDFQRLVLEFPGGPYSDDALLRLAREADFRGDLHRAFTHFQRLARDYPSSPLKGEALAWLRLNEGAVAALQTGAPSGSQGLPDSIPPPGPPEPDAADRGPISLQLGAFRNPAGARRLLEDLRHSGHLARLVRLPGSPLIRVRLGYFQDRQEARDLQQELDREGWDSTIVSDVHTEEKVGERSQP
ncbi:MAG: SPOR domain-containing protein [Gemmatimonadota bacterium]